MTHKLLQCKCGSPDHIIRLTLRTFTEGKKPEISFQVLVGVPAPWWRRLMACFRYMFMPRASHEQDSLYFRDFVLTDQSVDELSAVLARRKLVVRLQELVRKKRAHEASTVV